MYNPEITKIINENLRLDSVASTLIKDFKQAQDVASLERAEEIQEEIFQNRKTIEKMRGDN